MICSFCGKEDAAHLITGSTANICDWCTDVCADIVREAREEIVCLAAQAQWEGTEIASFAKLTFLIESCTKGVDLKYLLDRVDQQVQVGNLVLEDDQWLELSTRVNKIKDTLK